MGVVRLLLFSSVFSSLAPLASPFAITSRPEGTKRGLFSFPTDQDSDESPGGATRSLLDFGSDLSRRDAIFLGVGGIAYGKIVGDALSRVRRGDAYPEAHERRVADTFRATLMAAAAARSGAEKGITNSKERALRVLEVGVGSKCRTVQRGLYNSALEDLASSGLATGIELVGVDITTPNVDAAATAQEVLSGLAKGRQESFQTSFSVQQGDITQRLQFPDHFFDAVTCCLTLCSVSDQLAALNEIRRILNPQGGTFGYVEHVAVRLGQEGEEGRSFLEWQQRTLDPLQQLVADNCHLHRDTDLAVRDCFGLNPTDTRPNNEGQSRILEEERFFIDDMWPVSCQCRGVIQVHEV